MSELLRKIRSRGHWRVTIRPTKFIEKRIPELPSLYPIIEKAAVQLRGWDFPHLDTHTELHRDVDWIGQESEWQHHLEVWRMYQTGQFADVAGMMHDWRDQSTLWPAPAGWKPGSTLGVGDTLFRFTEIFEFAARLSLTPAGNDRVFVQVVLAGLRGRVLVVDDPRRAPMFGEYRASIDEFPYEEELPRTALVAEPRDFALRAVTELFWRFGWEPPKEVLKDQQSELRR